MEDFEKREGYEGNDNELFSKPVKAGKRTYFFDVKTTKDNDYYLTITESKRRVDRDGKFIYEKHKIFLYREDFEKFENGLKESFAYIAENAPEFVPRFSSENTSGEYRTNIDFDSL
jgi:hypothetical protein